MRGSDKEIYLQTITIHKNKSKKIKYRDNTIISDRNRSMSIKIQKILIKIYEIYDLICVLFKGVVSLFSIFNTMSLSFILFITINANDTPIILSLC